MTIPPSSLKKDQSFIRFCIVLSFITTIICYLLFSNVLLTIRVIKDEEFVYFVTGFWMTVSILRAAIYRSISTTDIAGQGMSNIPSPQMKILSAILQNTLEQSVLLVLVASLLLASSSDDDDRKQQKQEHNKFCCMVRVNACLFAIGRLLFTVGYDRGIGIGRGLGFGLSFIPQVLSLIIWMATKVLSVAGFF